MISFYEVYVDKQSDGFGGSRLLGRYAGDNAEEVAVAAAQKAVPYGPYVMCISINEDNCGESTQERIWGYRAFNVDPHYGYLDKRDVPREQDPDYVKYLELKERFGEES